MDLREYTQSCLISSLSYEISLLSNSDIVDYYYNYNIIDKLLH